MCESSEGVKIWYGAVQLIITEYRTCPTRMSPTFVKQLLFNDQRTVSFAQDFVDYMDNDDSVLKSLYAFKQVLPSIFQDLMQILSLTFCIMFKASNSL